jgi:cupin fold WbuC family metalloprotein
MNHKKVNEEVFIAQGGVVQVRQLDVAFLKGQAQVSPKRRARLCTHPGAQDRLHEMLILLDGSTYVRPHRHGGKSESFHIIEGELDVFLFNDDGTIRDIIRMGDYRSGKVFFYRLMDDTYHMPVITGPYVLFHETTNGPFKREDTEFAPWSPEENDPAAAAYLDRLKVLARNQAISA